MNGSRPSAPPSRRIVVFADGTGNAFSAQESNVWRLYQALDQSDRPDQPRQIARYIKGVGTSSFRPFAILDAATGFGVPSNVRKLYRFICWNWQPGDEIWMFGFSRGAFTIRTLAGLIASQGLVPSQFGTEQTSRMEMDRNAMAAWRAYRSRSALWYRSSPLIWLGRALRDGWLFIYHRSLGHRSYAAVLAEMDRQAREGRDRRGVGRGAAGQPGRISVPIAFLGLFDTVEAFGVPFEEMRRAVDWAVWPLSFRNKELSPCVEHARHALALDDERTSFHPVRFDQANATAGGSKRGRIKEVWFAGVHSDVGGGYPDGELSYVPLVWMAKEAQRAATGLRLVEGALQGFQTIASAFGPVHDSRSGLGVAYRYDPRTIETKRGPRPVVHRSVLSKMVLGSERYAPVMLPADADVLLDDGRLRKAIADPTMRQALAREAHDERAPKPLPDLAQVDCLPAPDPGYIALTRDGVWWRRVAYFLLLLTVLAVLLLPWIVDQLTDGFRATASWVAVRLGLGDWWEQAWRWLVAANDAVGGTLEAASTKAGGLVPSYLARYVKVIVDRPLPSLAVLSLAFSVYRLNSNLRDFIADKSRCAWFANATSTNDPKPPAPIEPKPGPCMRVARFFRQSLPSKALHWITTHYVLPAAIVVAMAAAALVGASRLTVIVRTDRSAYCRTDFSRPPRLVGEEAPQVVPGPFETTDVCRPTGLAIEKGRRYLVRIEVVEPFRDADVEAGALGFQSWRWPFPLALALRRRLDADWFQPVARIGLAGGVEFPLRPIDDAPTPAAGPDAAMHRMLVSEFTAQAGGELFLYVNDVMIGLPFICDCTFYRNNQGWARITVAKFPLPDLGPLAAP